MKPLLLALGMATALLAVGACSNQVSDKDAIRSGILQHLTAIGTLNMAAMDIDVRSVSINGNQAHAEVEFRPKTGGAPGAGMEVAYNLEKREGSWVVIRTQPLGGMIQHPDPSKNPHMNQSVHSSSLPNFDDVLNLPGATSPGRLPPGHPPVSSQSSSPQSGDQALTPAKRPD